MFAVVVKAEITPVSTVAPQTLEEVVVMKVVIALVNPGSPGGGPSIADNCVVPVKDENTEMFFPLSNPSNTPSCVTSRTRA